MQITGKHGSDVAHTLMGLGVDPTTLFHSTDEFELESSLLQIKTSVSDTKDTIISIEQQIDLVTALLENPLERSSYVCAISCYPTDVRSKVLGSELMRAAWEASTQLGAGTKRRRPMWITLTNRFYDYDALQAKNPCALFISNVTDDMTSQKFERLRDLLEVFSTIPRFVMMGSREDPLTLFANRIRYGVTYPIMLKGKSVPVSILDGM